MAQGLPYGMMSALEKRRMNKKGKRIKNE